MKFSLAITFAVTLLFFLSISADRTSGDLKGKHFIDFKTRRVSEGSIINVPIQCPPDTVRVGNHCRHVY
ncbi:hypothetical protein X777_10956 [Ooceraea biroi]|uniref:Secapin n=1 Tax=Ooceraea biroi TaxID=2015173 RepID=A0A026W3G0_OOCBI|nr:hypothetical protein X777_10956 [Ooceraea biroi]